MHVLYIEDNDADAELIEQTLQKSASHIQLDRVTTIGEALARLESSDKPDYKLVLSDLHLPDGGHLSLLDYIREVGLILPVIVITGRGDEETAISIMKAGADDYIIKRGDYLAQLPTILEDTLRRYQTGALRNQHPLRVLYAEPNTVDVDLTRYHLARYTPHIRLTGVVNAADVLQHLAHSEGETAYDLLLLDYCPPDMNALDLLKEVRQIRRLDIPIVVATPQGNEDVAIQALKLGATDYLVKSSGYLYRLPAVIENAYHRARWLQERTTLQQSEEKYRRLVELAQEGIWMIDRDACTTFANPRIAEMLGYTVEEMLGRPFLDFVHEHDRKIARSKLTRLRRGAKELYDCQFIRKDGSRLYATLATAPVLDEDGNYGGAIAGVIDVTARRAIEEAYYTLVEHSAQGLAIIQDGRMVFVNAALAELSGYSRQELLNLSPQELKTLIHPDDRDAVWQRLQERLAGKPLPPAYEFRYLRKDGTVGWVEIRSNRIIYQGRPAAQVAFLNITARKTAETALRRQVERTRQLLDTTLDGYLLADTEGQIVDVNPAYCHMTGYSREELLQMNIRDLEALLSPPEIEERIAMMVAAGGARFETRHQAKDGRIIDLDVSITILHVDGERGPLVAAFVRDITERKRTVAEIKQLKEFNESIVQGVTEGIFIEDTEGYFTFVNPAGAKMLGYNTPEEIIGRHWTTIVPSDQHPVVERKNEQRRKGVADQYELELVRKDGVRLSVLISGRPWMDPETRQFAGTLAIITDITDRVQMEYELRRRNRELELLNQIIAASATSLEPESILATACRELAQTFDLPRAAATLLNADKTEGRVVAEYVEPGNKPILNTTIQVQENPPLQYLLTHKAPLAIDDVARDSRFKSLRKALCRADTASLLFTPLVIDNDVVGDISLEGTRPHHFSPDEINLAWNVADQVAGALAQVKLREEREKLAEQYRQAQKMEAIGHLTGGIAHDFNNILTAINGYAEMLKMQLPPYDPRREMAAHILAAGERAARLVRQLLAFSRKQLIQPQVLDLTALITEISAMLKRVIREDIELKLALPSDLWPVKMDPSQIEQMILNLAVNARDAMPRGGTLFIGANNVTLDAEYAAHHLDMAPGDYVRLTISDTGVGMPPEVLEHIFEPFFTTKDRATGTGLGLSTVYGIVKQNDGEIEVYSEVGKGTSFKIYLPRYGSEQTETELQETGVAIPGFPPIGSEVILLVEDDAAVREFAREVLVRQGHTVLEASNGREALQRAQEHNGPIHLLLTDVVMPGGNGQTLAEQLAKIRPEIKILFISGYSEEMIARYNLPASHIAFLPKPFSSLALARKVRDILDAPPSEKEIL